MGGPWRDRSYTPSVPTYQRPPEFSGKSEHMSLLGAYLTGIIIGAIGGIIVFWAAIPFLPFVQGR
jgi:hypothetical protein